MDQLFNFLTGYICIDNCTVEHPSEKTSLPMGFIVPGRNNTKLLSSKSKVKVNENNIHKLVHYTKKSLRQKKLPSKPAEKHHKTDIYDIPIEILKTIFLNLSLSDIQNLPLHLKLLFDEVYTNDAFFRATYIQTWLIKDPGSFYTDIFTYSQYLKIYLDAVLAGNDHAMIDVEKVDDSFKDIQQIDQKCGDLIIDFIIRCVQEEKLGYINNLRWISFPYSRKIYGVASLYTDDNLFKWILNEVFLRMYKHNLVLRFSSLMTALNLYYVVVCKDAWQIRNRGVEVTGHMIEPGDNVNYSFFRYFLMFHIVTSMVKYNKFEVNGEENFANFVTNLVMYLAVFDADVNENLNEPRKGSFFIVDGVLQDVFSSDETWKPIFQATFKGTKIRSTYQRTAYRTLYYTVMHDVDYADRDLAIAIPDVSEML